MGLKWVIQLRSPAFREPLIREPLIKATAPHTVANQPGLVIPQISIHHFSALLLELLDVPPRISIFRPLLNRRPGLVLLILMETDLTFLGNV